MAPAACLPVQGAPGSEFCSRSRGVCLEASQSRCLPASHPTGTQLVGWCSPRHSRDPHFNSRALSLCCSFLLCSALKSQTPQPPWDPGFAHVTSGDYVLILLHHLKNVSSERSPPCLVPFHQCSQSSSACGPTSNDSCFINR